jgi:hypothetical protein
MKITNNQELAAAVSEASEIHQAIQDYCSRTNREDAKIKFPRGLIRTADTYRERFPSYLDRDKVSMLLLVYVPRRTVVAILSHRSRRHRQADGIEIGDHHTWNYFGSMPLRS